MNEWVRVFRLIIDINKVGLSVMEKNPFAFEAQQQYGSVQQSFVNKEKEAEIDRRAASKVITQNLQDMDQAFAQIDDEHGRTNSLPAKLLQETKKKVFSPKKEQNEVQATMLSQPNITLVQNITINQMMAPQAEPQQPQSHRQTTSENLLPPQIRKVKKKKKKKVKSNHFNATGVNHMHEQTAPLNKTVQEISH